MRASENVGLQTGGCTPKHQSTTKARLFIFFAIYLFGDLNEKKGAGWVKKMNKRAILAP